MYLRYSRPLSFTHNVGLQGLTAPFSLWSFMVPTDNS